MIVFYLKYEAPEDEQNFPMVMELLRAGEVHENMLWQHLKCYIPSVWKDP